MEPRRRRVPIPDNIQARITKLFVTNLPEGCSGADLAAQVRSFGQIYDLYIARKRDKSGNRFGFISVLDVKDKTELLRNLRGIRLGDSKLWFNIARFVLEEGEIGSNDERHFQHNDNNIHSKKSESSFYNYNDNSTHHTEGYHGHSSAAFGSGSKSFRDLFEGKTINLQNNVNAFSALHGKAIVVKMVNVLEVKNIFVTLNEICPGHGQVQYLGGLDMLISFEDEEKARNALEIAKLMKERFLTVSIWDGQTLGFERIAWLKVQGVPLHLWSNEVFNLIGSKFGKVVHKANISETDRDLSFEYVGVLVGDGKRISDELTLVWKSRKFKVWILEDQTDWIPDFVPVNESYKEAESDIGVEVRNNDEGVEVTHSPETEMPDIGAELNEGADFLETPVNTGRSPLKQGFK